MRNSRIFSCQPRLLLSLFDSCIRSMHLDLAVPLAPWLFFLWLRFPVGTIKHDGNEWGICDFAQGSRIVWVVNKLGSLGGVYDSQKNPESLKTGDSGRPCQRIGKLLEPPNDSSPIPDSRPPIFSPKSCIFSGMTSEVTLSTSPTRHRQSGLAQLFDGLRRCKVVPQCIVTGNPW
ncbi:hypothetical protein GGS24DRAFT_457516 [Hypoxylon argillaceum]|nr:hypothetical protein GGS24DRAFT_457516 [Hypoxylon argillaceum]